MLQDSRENKTNCFPRDHTLSVYCYTSNTFPDLKRTCHVPLVKSQRRPRANNNLNFGLARDHVVLLETAGNLCTGRPDEESH